jgi:hypothetical protein
MIKVTYLDNMEVNGFGDGSESLGSYIDEIWNYCSSDGHGFGSGFHARGRDTGDGTGGGDEDGKGNDGFGYGEATSFGSSSGTTFGKGGLGYEDQFIYALTV